MTRDYSRSSSAPLLFLGETVLSQAIGCAVMVVTWSILPNRAVALFAGTLVALLTATFLRLSFPWQVVNFLLIPSCAASLAVEFPPGLLFAFLLVTLIIYAPAFWTRVPYYPTSRATYAVLLAQLPADRPFTFIDIGCGFGDLILFLSKHRPEGHFVGVEIGVLPFVGAWLRAVLGRRKQVRVRFSSMWQLNLSAYDYVYAFLSPAPMTRLWEKAAAEMRPGTTFITNSFAAPVPATRSLAIKDDRKSVIFIHEMDRVKEAVSTTKK